MNTPAGRINRLFGTDGGVMLTLYAAFPDDFDPATTPLLVTLDALEVPLWCERFERRGASGAVAAFADLDTERRASELLGLEFRIAEQAAADDDEFYLEDLVGFAVEAEEVGGTTGEGEDATGKAGPDRTHSDEIGKSGANQTGGHATGKTGADRPHCNATGKAGTDRAGATATRRLRGTLTDYYDSDVNPLFELEIEGRKVLVPAVEEFIARIDFDRRTIRFVLPEGLLDL